MGGGMVEPEQCAADLNSGQAVSQRYSRGRLVPGFERHAGVMQLCAGLRRPRKVVGAAQRYSQRRACSFAVGSAV